MDILISRTEEFVAVKLTGDINKDNELADHLEQMVGGTIVIDLSEVERINSCGVRDWVNWIHALEARGSELFLVDCSPSIVAQVNLVTNFTGHGRIKSIYLPYYCESCNREDNVLYQAEELAMPQSLPPASRCSGCEKFMDFDDMPDAYFAFLSNRDRLLLGEAAMSAQKFSLPKSFLARKPQFATGSRSLADIDYLLENTHETKSFEHPQDMQAREASGPSCYAHRATLASIALLLTGAAMLAYALT